MIRKLLFSNLFFLRGSRDILNKGVVNFPFRLGGIDKNIPNEPIIQSFFGVDLKPMFTKTYGDLLQSVANKDEAWLKKYVEPKLVHPLLPKDSYKLINSNSPIELAFNSIQVGMGAKFEREESEEYQLITSQMNTVFYMKKNYRPTSSTAPLLFTFNISARSPRKIVSKAQSSSQAQTHLIVIESELQIGMQQLRNILMISEQTQAMNSFKKLYLNQKQVWKIGNIDQYLKKRI